MRREEEHVGKATMSMAVNRHFDRPVSPADATSRKRNQEKGRRSLDQRLISFPG